MADFNPGNFNFDPNSARPGNGTSANLGNGAAPFNNGGGSQPPGSGGHGGQGGGQGGHGGQGHGHGSSSHGMDTSADGLGHILARQWHVVVLSTIVVLMLSVLYILLVKKTYTSVSTLRVAPLDPATISTNSSSPEMQADSDFLETECITIKSNSVISLAMDKISQTATLQGMQHPMDYVRMHLQADPSKVGRAIDVSFDCHSQDDADLIVDSVVDAYREYVSQAWKSRAKDYLTALEEGGQSQAEELVKTQTALHDLVVKNGFTPDSDPEKSPQHMEVLSLREAKQKAQIETIRAQSAYQQAAKAIIGHDDLVGAVDKAMQDAAPSTDAEEQLKKYEDELTVEQAQLEDHLRSYGPNHPTIATEQARVNQMIVRTVVAAKEWEESALASEDRIARALKGASEAESAMADAQREYIRLRAEADRLTKLNDSVDDRRHEVKLQSNNTALSIMVLNQDIKGDVKPATFRTLAIALVLGLIGGLGLACVRDWTDDRMRTPQAIRATMGVPILGAIPSITTAYTAADRGQIVHHEPFGIASESYRTLRTALQFGLPPSTKTLLITSPVSGDGKSTFVSNLGIALAQASKRILIVDADFRAPMQHRLFGLKDRIGFATVLNGSDTIEQAIQRTEIEGLDVLPCGPTPSNPAEMLNSPAFTDHLNELADKYDLVLIDSPPVTAVADARILAASADVSLIVIRLESSTRKQAEAARDGLRSVGARLIGVAVNGVNRAAHFGGATGYYQTGTNVTPGFERTGKRSYSEHEAVSDPTGRA